MQRKARQRKAKKSKAQQSNIVCRSVCQCPTLKPQQRAGCGRRARFASAALPRLASLFLSSPLISCLIFVVCRMRAEPSNATKREATKSRSKKCNAKQRRMSVCLSMSYLQTTTASRIRVACAFRPMHTFSPRLALLLFSSSLLSYNCVCRMGAEQSKATKHKATKSEPKKSKSKATSSVGLSVNVISSNHNN
jgi:hypothetical protein